MPLKRLLVIDDEQEICNLIREVAEGEGFEVSTTVDPEVFKTAVASFKPTVLVLDLVMPETGCKIPILVMSGYSGKLLESARSLGDAFGLPCVQSLKKPIRIKHLRQALSDIS